MPGAGDGDGRQLDLSDSSDDFGTWISLLIASGATQSLAAYDGRVPLLLPRLELDVVSTKKNTSAALEAENTKLRERLAELEPPAPMSPDELEAKLPAGWHLVSADANHPRRPTGRYHAHHTVSGADQYGGNPEELLARIEAWREHQPRSVVTVLHREAAPPADEARRLVVIEDGPEAA